MKQQPLQVTELDAFGEKANFTEQAPARKETLAQKRRREATEEKAKPSQPHHSPNSLEWLKPLPELGPHQVQTWEGQALCLIHDCRHSDQEPCLFCLQGQPPLKGTVAKKTCQKHTETLTVAVEALNEVTL